MKNRVFYALLGIALAAPVAAFAGEPNTNSQSGHYEWRQSPNYGPRAPSMSPRRVWVPDAPQMANCKYTPIFSVYLYCLFPTTAGDAASCLRELRLKLCNFGHAPIIDTVRGLAI